MEDEGEVDDAGTECWKKERERTQKEVVIPGYTLERKTKADTWAFDDFTALSFESTSGSLADLRYGREADPDGFKWSENNSFHKCVDVYFTRIENEKAEEQHTSQLNQVMSRVDKIRIGQQKRVDALAEEQTKRMKQAELVEMNLELVDTCILMLKTAIASSLDWSDLAKVIEVQAQQGHPIASYIHELQLRENKVDENLEYHGRN